MQRDADKGIANTRQTNHKRSTKEVPPWNGQYNILLKGSNQFYGANLTLDSDVDQDIFGKVTKPNTHNSQEISPSPAGDHKSLWPWWQRGFGLQTLWWFWLKDLSIDEMIGAWCFGCLSGLPGFICWISFAPVFSFIYCRVLIFALSPCYILIYMF